ncbi:MAG: VpsF family polysaccharide biosynthesis protein [Siculibacillus sp.]|nr:VpsF family polysaccharide biosynthesis protein [Siculibacillus sp.]
MSLVQSTLPFPGASPARGARSDVLGRPARWLLWAGVAAMATISSMALVAAGIPYSTSGGSFFTKIHPATWAATAAVLAAMLDMGGPGRWAARVSLERPGLVALAAAVIMVFLHTALVQKLPLSAIIDTFVLPILVFVAVDALDPASRRRTATALHLFVAINAVVGLVEYASGWRLTPMYDIDGSIIVDWRSTALLGHPLNNAFITGGWLVMLATGGGRAMRTSVRAAAMVLAATALVAFGGRVAMVLALMMTLAAGGLGALQTFAGRRFGLGGATIAVAAMTIATVVAIVAIDAGAADRLIERFRDDSGSAGTRVAMFRIFADLGWEEFLFGPRPELMIQAQRDYGIRIGIESTEVAFVAFYGLIPATLLLAALGAYLFELIRATSWASLWPVVFFAVVMSASTGLSSKSTLPALFAVMVLTMMPRWTDHSGPRSPRSSSRSPPTAVSSPSTAPTRSPVSCVDAAP